MRIACVHLPSFALQVHVRKAPHRAGQAFAIVHGPRDEAGEFVAPKRKLLVCSKAAYKLGLRPGMSATQARALAPDIELIPSDPTLYQRSLEALAESFLALSVTVDIGESLSKAATLSQHQCVYLRVPKKQSGDSFAQKLLGALDRQGYRGRIGVADTRFTAWAATQGCARNRAGELFDPMCTVVPRGGNAAFLAPMSIELLPMSEDVRQMLVTLGIQTLGDFASLPPPSVGRRFHESGVDYQSLAKGEGPTLLRAFAPRDEIVELIQLEGDVSESEALSFALRPLADRTCDRLRGRSMAVAEALLRLRGRDDRCTEIPVRPARPTAEGRKLFDHLRALIQDRRLDHEVQEIELVVSEESDPEIEELDLFDFRDSRPSFESVDIAIARLESMFGKDSVSSAELVASHRPERAYKLTPFCPPKSPRRTRRKARGGKKAGRKRRTGNRGQHEQTALPLVMNGTSGAMRIVDPPKPQARGLQSINVEGTQRPVVSTLGPTKVDTEWWSNEPVERDYYEVETEDGGRYWVFQKDDRYYLHGIFD